MFITGYWVGAVITSLCFIVTISYREFHHKAKHYGHSTPNGTLLYECDSAKNTECKAHVCGNCHRTSYKKYAKGLFPIGKTSREWMKIDNNKARHGVPRSRVTTLIPEPPYGGSNIHSDVVILPMDTSYEAYVKAIKERQKHEALEDIQTKPIDGATY